MDCADQICEGVHQLIARLQPAALDRFGLLDAFQDLLGDWRLATGDWITPASS
jgi:two-component system sensor histidine kinase UhpB